MQWTGGGFDTSLGNVTNRGALPARARREKPVRPRALDDFGAITQNGSGNLTLRTDSGSAALIIETGGSYVFQTDSGIAAPTSDTSGISNASMNAQTARGTSIISIRRAFSEHRTPSRPIPRPALDVGGIASTLVRHIDGPPMDCNPWSNADISPEHRNRRNPVSGRVVLEDAGSTISGLAGLSDNGGSLSLSGGAELTIPGDLYNSGALTVGAESKLNVGGRFTQASTGTLNLQIAERRKAANSARSPSNRRRL